MSPDRNIKCGGLLQEVLERRQREQIEQKQSEGLEPVTAVLLGLVICLARLAAQADTSGLVR